MILAIKTRPLKAVKLRIGIQDDSSTRCRAFTQGAAPSKPPSSPSFHFSFTHYLNFAQAIFYRSAGFDIIWRRFATVAAIGLIFFTVALVRFRRTVAVS